MMSSESARVAAPESAKRAQIIEGARRCFLASGFEAASMAEIAREAKVSKGTLYVYFDSKEALFSALVEQSRRASVERLMDFDYEHANVRDALVHFATGLIGKLSAPEHVALVRMVIGASEKFPGVARDYFEAGPAHGAARLAGYLREQERLGMVSIPDIETAAWQFFGMCHHPTLISVLLAARPAPDGERVRILAETAVTTFLAAYATKR
ncbi:TetR/AcrR family transcriptional regulator [uncultured Amaricoccus sp.]|uniref:TetR/AcrR family transcriptional regulator n=1 Tax=uncultured Amaricoccus sp. TaxID=339341 RepID=UPI002608B405|nr:TetR/AcrR family transcriptional regulator [uncultured Amaricoccus sp.]